MLPQLAQDKANHAIYGALIARVAMLIAPNFGVDPRIAGIAAAVVFGVGKEALDAAMNYRATGDWQHGPHGVEFYDALATSLGGVVVAV